MTKKELGHIELQWTCPNCGGVNPGSERLCQTCGAPQPDDVEFELPARQELISDEEKVEAAEAGADIHCGYCEARNPSGAEVCRQCGADLSAGERREAGRVVGAFRTGPAGEIDCPHCDMPNPDTATHCSNCGGSLAREAPAPETAPTTAPPKAPARRRNPLLAGALILVAILACVAVAVLVYLSTRTEAVTGVVRGVGWERSVAIEALVPVDRQDWHDEIPQEARLGACQQRVRSVQDEPAPGAREVCGTPYTVDTGGGFADVVQDCVYEVPDDFCTYTVDEWQVVDTLTARGEDYAPRWPDARLEEGQRLSSETEEAYACFFDTDQGDRVYRSSEADLLNLCQLGSRLQLEINAFGNVVSIER